jgi:6-phosphofructokinase 1
MGRYAGWIALYAGVAGGADVILIPEIPFDLNIVAERLREREKFGARFSIVVVAEGAVPIGGTVSRIAEGDAATAERLGGFSATCARQLEKLTGKEARYVVLGHLQRGGTPTSHDRVLATRFGGKAVECVLNGEFDVMVASQPPDIVTVPLEFVVGKQKRVPPDFDLIRTARAMGITFGDATS